MRGRLPFFPSPPTLNSVSEPRSRAAYIVLHVLLAVIHRPLDCTHAAVTAANHFGPGGVEKLLRVVRVGGERHVLVELLLLLVFQVELLAHLVVGEHFVVLARLHVFVRKLPDAVSDELMGKFAVEEAVEDAEGHERTPPSGTVDEGVGRAPSAPPLVSVDDEGDEHVLGCTFLFLHR